MTIPKFRVRAKRPKTTTGCRTCKIRHIKCDEAKPSCQRCSSTGRTCDGYEVQPPLSSSHVLRAARPNTVIPPQSLAAFPLLTPEELSSLTFFQRKSSREIRGPFHFDLWECMVLQLSAQEPSIIHAAIAIGGTHRRLLEKGALSSEARLQRHQFSLRQYVKAITSLRARIEGSRDSDANEVAMVACILFISLELMHGQRISALGHLATGLRICLPSSALRQHPEGAGVQGNALVARCGSQTLLDQLVNVFARLDFESTMFGVPAPQVLLLPPKAPGVHVAMPTLFDSLGMARQYLDVLSNGGFRFRGALLQIAAGHVLNSADMDLAIWLCWEHATTRQVDLAEHPALLSELRRLQNGLAVWAAALEAFRTRNRALSAADERTLVLLEIQHFYPYFLISTCETTRERFCDSFADLFSRTVSLAKLYLLGASPHSPLFTLECGIIPSLYFTAMKCYDPPTRRRAIALPRATSCQEGMWEAALIAQFVERVADLQEAQPQSLKRRWNIMLAYLGYNMIAAVALLSFHVRVGDHGVRMVFV